MIFLTSNVETVAESSLAALGKDFFYFCDTLFRHR